MSVIEVLVDLGVAVQAPEPYSASIELREHQKHELLLPSWFDVALVGRLFQSFDAAIKQGLVEVDVALEKTGGFRLKLSTSNIVGHAIVTDNDKRVFLAVRPKVPTSRILQLALAAENLPAWKAELTTGVDPDASTLEWTVAAFTAEVETLLSTGGVRSSHERRTEELRARVRGRLLITPYVRNMALGKPDRIPCEFGTLHFDNLPNRVIRWTLHICSMIVKELPQSERLLKQLRRVDISFSGVHLVQPSHRDMANLTSLSAGFRHYKRALSWAQVILKRFNLDAHVGSYSAPSVGLDMNKLYEGAFFNLLKKHAPTAQRQVSWPIKFLNEEGDVKRKATYKPDILIPGDTRNLALILDTKWKAPKPRPSEDKDDILFVENKAQLIPILTTDLYQITSYALEATAQEESECVGMLVYPTLGKVDVLRRRLAIGPKALTIHMIGWDVTAAPDESVLEVWQYIEKTREIPNLS
jgi:5-methylcytosine-specific restriction endonuclease McrBC regulatory subunit McrC